MRRFLVPCLFLVVMMWHAFPLFSAETGGIPATGNKQDKLEELLAIVKGGTRNADLHYNIGVAYFEAGSPGKATLHYLKALAINSAHTRARNNLNYLQDLLFSGNADGSRPFLEGLLYKAYYFLSLDRSALLCLILLLLTVLVLHWLIRYPEDKERGLPLLLLMFCVILLLGSILFLAIKQHRVNRNDTGVVTSPDAPIYDDQDGTTGSGRVSMEGTILHVLDREKPFIRVRSEDGNAFWLRSTDVEMVREDL